MVSVTTPFFAAEFDGGERILHKVKGRMPVQFARYATLSLIVKILDHDY